MTTVVHTHTHTHATSQTPRDTARYIAHTHDSGVGEVPLQLRQRMWRCAEGSSALLLLDKTRLANRWAVGLGRAA